MQINWCGDGVPEAKKGLFHTHSSAVGKFLRGAHVVISARNEVRHGSHSFGHVLMFPSKGDVDPVLIMSRVEAASGTNYTAQKEAPRAFEAITPVGTNYKPVGKVDIAALRATSTPSVPSAAKPPPPPSAPRPAFGGLKPATTAASLYGRVPASTAPVTPVDAWDEEMPSSSPPPSAPPAASRGPAFPTTARPTFSALVSQYRVSET